MYITHSPMIPVDPSTFWGSINRVGVAFSTYPVPWKYIRIHRGTLPEGWESPVEIATVYTCRSLYEGGVGFMCVVLPLVASLFYAWCWSRMCWIKTPWSYDNSWNSTNISECTNYVCFSNFLSMGTDRERSHGFFVHDHLPLFDDAVKSLNSEMFALAFQFPTRANMCTYYGSMPPCSRNMELTEIIANTERCLTLLWNNVTNDDDSDKAEHPEGINI